ncbi:Hpr(Ser) kinase/phosphatase [Hasllibacter halocynthiae]|uniref:Hpr(Ser) kinase/phosphatase n=1 Tax=Hasllibacter halocynthiae TaxID=595589 RepID=A0A2T0X3B7_9RHOB|nr:serine kinase [Hasllibacter halocynthiae]PRY93442.1 Hpr(Ser) kinase/phosphatase [Hasllibacter halocynthiae]
MTARPLDLHGGAVSWRGAGLLILGASGSGKSSLALRLIALGAGFVADDRVRLSGGGGALHARGRPGAPAAVARRGIGLVPVPPGEGARVVLAVRTDRREDRRLPPARRLRLLGHAVPVLHAGPEPGFAEGLLVLLKALGPP